MNAVIKPTIKQSTFTSPPPLVNHHRNVNITIRPRYHAMSNNPGLYKHVLMILLKDC